MRIRALWIIAAAILALGWAWIEVCSEGSSKAKRTSASLRESANAETDEISARETHDVSVEPAPFSPAKREMQSEPAAANTIAVSVRVLAGLGGPSIDSATVSATAVNLKSSPNSVVGVSNKDGCADLRFAPSEYGEKWNIHAAAPGFFPAHQELVVGQSSITVILERQCSVSGVVDWAMDGRGFFGGAWGLFACIDSEASQMAAKRRREAIRSTGALAYLKAYNKGRFTSPANGSWNENQVVSSELDCQLLSVPIRGRAFEFGGLHLGDSGELVLFLDDSDPLFFEFSVHETQTDIGAIAIPGLAVVRIRIESGMGEPVYPDPQLQVWCINSRTSDFGARAISPGYWRKRSVVFNDRDETTSAAFWCQWGEDYVFGIVGDNVSSQVKLAVPVGVEEIDAGIVMRSSVQAHSDGDLRVCDRQGKAVANAKLEIKGDGDTSTMVHYSDEAGRILVRLSAISSCESRASAIGYSSKSFKKGEVPAVIELEQAAPRSFYPVQFAVGGGLVSSAVRLIYFADAQDKKRIEVSSSVVGGTLVVDEPATDVDSVYLLAEDCIPCRLYKRAAGGWNASQGVELHTSVECMVSVAGLGGEREILLDQGLLQAVVLELPMPDDSSLCVRRTIGLRLDGGPSRVRVWNASERVGVYWPKYGGDEMFLGYIVPSVSPVGAELRLKVPR